MGLDELLENNSLNGNVKNKTAYEKLLRAEKTRKTIRRYAFPDKEKLILVPMGDEHIGNLHYDEETHRKHVDWCGEKGAYVILMGDTLETATKTSVGAGVFEQDEIVEEQYEKACEIYQPLADAEQILGIHIGNHEMRVFKNSGANLTRMLAKQLNIPYLGLGAVTQIKVGKQNYFIYTTHGTSGARLPHTKIKSALDIQNMIEDIDVYAMGHLHALDHHVKNVYCLDKRNRQISERQIHFLLTGAYLSHWGSYAHAKNYSPARKGSPKIKLSGLEKRIRVSL